MKETSGSQHGTNETDTPEIDTTEEWTLLDGRRRPMDSGLEGSLD